MNGTTGEAGFYVFESFRLDPVRRTLTRDDVRVNITPRLFEILLYLVRHHSRVVARDELQLEIWDRRTMDGTNLAVAISSLRKALHGDEHRKDLIATVPEQGYRLITAVTYETTADHAASVQFETASTVGGIRADRAAPGLWRNAAFAAVLVGAVATPGAAIWLMTRAADQSAGPPAAVFAPPPHSVAVMAFTNLNGDATKDYFSDGISDELINALWQIGALRVVPPSSSFSFKGKSTSVQDIARRLNVGTVVEGSVRRDANRFVIRAEMRDGITGGLIWSQTYDRDENQILKIQEDLAQAVATTLQQTIADADGAGLMVGGTSNATALDLYLRAAAAKRVSNGSEAAFKQIVALFEAAIALDPKFAMAKADLSITIYNHIATDGGRDLAYLQRLRQRARNVAEEAVALAPNSALGHEALGYALGVALPDFTAQEAEFARARSLAPGNRRIVCDYARFAIWAGHTEAGVKVAEQSAALSPMSAAVYYELAWNLYYARRPYDALAALHHAEELGRMPDNAVRKMSGLIALLRGDAATAQLACTGLDNFTGHECLAIAYHARGRPAEAAAELAKMHDEAGDSGVFNYAEVSAQWGRSDEALQWLETAYRLNDPTLVTLKTNFLLDPIRQTPRFKAIESALHFPT